MKKILGISVSVASAFCVAHAAPMVYVNGVSVGPTYNGVGNPEIFEGVDGLKVTGGGVANLGLSQVGNGSVASVTVSDIGSEINVGRFDIGVSAQNANTINQLNILNGATVKVVDQLGIGQRTTTSAGKVVVDGVGTGLSADVIVLGTDSSGTAQGYGELEVTNGAKVTSNYLDFGKVGALGPNKLSISGLGSSVSADIVSMYGAAEISVVADAKFTGTEIELSEPGSKVYVENTNGSENLKFQRINFGTLGGGLELHTSGEGVSQFTTQLLGKGTLTVSGGGVTRFTANNNQFSGALDVTGGTLILGDTLGTNDLITNVTNATLGGGGNINGTVNINSGGFYEGTGVVGRDLVINAGGTLSPGGSEIGNSGVSGKLTFNDSSAYAVDLSGANSDKVTANNASIGNDVKVNFTALDNTADYGAGQVYEILTTSNGVVGEFSSTGTNAFLASTFEYTPNSVKLKVAVKSPQVFELAAQTPNERRVARAIGSMSSAASQRGLYNQLLTLGSDFSQARSAYNQLTGEVYAANKTALINTSASLQEATNNHLLYHSGNELLSEERQGKSSVWILPMGEHIKTDAGNGASSLKQRSTGMLFGADTEVYSGTRLGVFGGYTKTTADVSRLDSKSTTDGYHLGVYGKHDVGIVEIRSGASYSWNDVSTKRKVQFAQYSDRLSSNHDSNNAQVFTEADYKIEFSGGTLRPFVNATYLVLDDDGFKEKGGSAALRARSSKTQVGFSTVGLRASMPVLVGGVNFTANSQLGWKRAYGDLDTSSKQSFNGSDTFNVSGVPVAKDATIIGVGANFPLAKAVDLGVNYSGQYGSNTSDSAVNASVSLRF